MKIINKQGQVVDHADGEIIPDGCGIRVPSFLMDGVPIVDTDPDAPARASYEAHKAWLKDAWRTPQTQDATHVREAHKAGLQDTGKTKPAVVEDQAQHNAAPDSEAAWRALVRRTENAWRTR